MAISSAESNGKRKLKDDLETKPILKKHKEVALRKKTLFFARLSWRTGIADIIDHFKDVGKIVRVQLLGTTGSKKKGCGFIKFSSAKEAEKALQKSGTLHGRQVLVYVAIPPGFPVVPKFCKDHQVWKKNYILREEDETLPTSVENVLFVSNLSPQTKLFHIIDCFSDIGEVVSVRFIVNPEGKHVGYCFVEFDSADEAHEALELLNGEYLLDHMIFLDVAKLPPYRLRHKYNLAEKLCYEDYLRREMLLIDEDETSGEEEEGLDDETPTFVEASAVRNKTIFVTHLSHQIEIQDIIDLFKDVGQVVHVRLLIDCEGNQTDKGYVEFASAKEAKKALKKKYLHDHGIFIFKADGFSEFQLPMYCIDHKIWYEGYLRRKNLLIEEDDAVEIGFDETHDIAEEVALRKKTLFVYNLTPRMKIFDIIQYYKNVGHVCRVRLVVNQEGEHVGCGFVEFASVNEAEKALLYERRVMNILSDVVEMAPYPIRPRYKLAEKLWNENYVPPEEHYLEEPEEVPKLIRGKKITFSDDDDDV